MQSQPNKTSSGPVAKNVLEEMETGAGRKPEMLEKPKRKHRDAYRRRRSLLIGSVVGVAYALLTRYVLGFHAQNEVHVLSDTMTLGFLGLAPLALGAITVAFTPRGFRANYGHASGVSLLSAFIFLVVVGVLNWEVVICIAMASPIVFLMSELGGVLMCWLLRQVDKLRMGVRTKNYLVIVLIVAPFAVAPLENQVDAPDSIREVPTQITIHASPRAIWQNISRVPTIQPSEQSFDVIHLMGIPQPVQATLDHEGVGGVRHASFSDGLAFIETITEWRDLQTMTFTIKVDRSNPPPPPFSEIGGAYFDVLDGAYTLEPIGGGDVILHLSSHERLSTHFNGYGGLWTDFIMRDLQDDILRIVKHRAETGYSG